MEIQEIKIQIPIPGNKELNNVIYEDEYITLTFKDGFKKGDIIVSKLGNISMFERSELINGDHVVYYSAIYSTKFHVKTDMGVGTTSNNRLASTTEAERFFLKAAQAGYRYIDGKWEDIRFKLYSTWEEYCNNTVFYGKYYCKSDSKIVPFVDSIVDPYTDKNVFNSKGIGHAFLALSQLLLLRDAYRHGWVPDWKDKTVKYTIISCEDKIIYSDTTQYNTILSFQSEEIRNQFSRNFNDLIEIAKELI